MAYFNSRDSKPSVNSFVICRTNGPVGSAIVKSRRSKNDSISEMHVSRIFNVYDFMCSVKYFTEYGGYNYLSSNLEINLNSSVVLQTSNPTICIVNTSMGEMFIKKMTNGLTPSALQYIWRGSDHGIFARVFGYVNLLNDRYYNYGVIMEKCYQPTTITFSGMVRALRSLKDNYETNGGVLHGDCNPDNIMADRLGELKLVDPINLLTGQVNYTNETSYPDGTISTFADIKAFIRSCIQIYSRLNSVSFGDVYIINVDNSPIISAVKTGKNYINVEESFDDVINLFNHYIYRDETEVVDFDEIKRFFRRIEDFDNVHISGIDDEIDDLNASDSD